MSELNFYLAAANAYASQATSVFNMFLTVLFGSLAFAAAMSLKDIGNQVNIYKINFNVSTSSLLIGSALLSFYIISFIVFHSLSMKANVLIVAMLEKAEIESISSDVVSSLSESTPEVAGLVLPSFGFLVGSLLSLVAFMWLANVKRNDKSA
jgi:hypothetical protein